MRKWFFCCTLTPENLNNKMSFTQKKKKTNTLNLWFVFVFVFVFCFAFVFTPPFFLGFPGGSDGKESACNAGDSWSVPGSGRSPGEGNSNPLFCLENPMDREARWATVHGVEESDATEQPADSLSIRWESYGDKCSSPCWLIDSLPTVSGH